MEDVHWINLAQDIENLWADVNTLMNTRVLWNAGNSLTIGTSGF